MRNLTIRAALVLALAFASGCGSGGDSSAQRAEQFNAEMRSWNQCRAATPWHTLAQLYAICGQIPPLPNP